MPFLLARRYERANICPKDCYVESIGTRLCLMTTLDQLPCGLRARVNAVVGEPAIVQRLLEMGVIEGEFVEVLGTAPLGDPIEIRLRDYRLCLRRSEAALVQIGVLTSDLKKTP